MWVLSLLLVHGLQSCPSAAIVPLHTVQITDVVQVGFAPVCPLWSHTVHLAVRVMFPVTAVSKSYFVSSRYQSVN